MRLVLVGGGTGGHFYPLMAIAEALRDRDRQAGQESELIYMGPSMYHEASLSALNIRFVSCPAGKKRNYFSLANYFDIFVTGWGVMVAFCKLLRLYPDAVMSKGGYTSVPVVLAAWLLRIPIVVHESDAVPGRANLLAARFATSITVAYAEVAEGFRGKKVTEVGMPISRAMRESGADPFGTLGIVKDRPVVLVTGGSSGAERINNFVIGALPQLLTKFTVVHQVGDAHVEKVSSTAASFFADQTVLSHYYVFGSLSQARFAAAIEAASLVVTRAGSTTLFEIAVKGKPAIVVPIPEDISRDQRSNAYAYARVTGATVLEEHNLSDDILAAEINRILDDASVRAEMAAGAKSLTVGEAAYTLADMLTEIAKEHE
jgi:UDP-N-acetylglucosamine--N-acetylmuramyl-(pentapeptide) pyrophosphoryl-undecaprenol N-acetylglucosamine transferase